MTQGAPTAAGAEPQRLSISFVGRGFRAALTFMTRLPLGGFPYSEAELKAAPAFFPLVGLVVGTLAALVFFLATPLGAVMAALITVIFSVWLTGAFHEDGLADTADGMGGSHSQKKLLDILKDSRIGTYGGAALCLSLMLRVSLLASLPIHSLLELRLGLTAPTALVLVHVLARTGPVVLMASLPYVAGERAKGAAVAKGGSWYLAAFACATALSLLSFMVYWGLSLLLAGALLLVGAAATWRFHCWFKARAGGFTGDFLGATEQALEMLLLLVVYAAPRTGDLSGGYDAWF